MADPECDFIEQELGYDKSLTILDVGLWYRQAHHRACQAWLYCHLSEAQLKRAKEKAGSRLQSCSVRADSA